MGNAFINQDSSFLGFFVRLCVSSAGCQMATTSWNRGSIMCRNSPFAIDACWIFCNAVVVHIMVVQMTL